MADLEWRTRASRQLAVVAPQLTWIAGPVADEQRDQRERVLRESFTRWREQLIKRAQEFARTDRWMRDWASTRSAFNFNAVTDFVTLNEVYARLHPYPGQAGGDRVTTPEQVEARHNQVRQLAARAMVVVLNWIRAEPVNDEFDQERGEVRILWMRLAGSGVPAHRELRDAVVTDFASLLAAWSSAVQQHVFLLALPGKNPADG